MDKRRLQSNKTKTAPSAASLRTEDGVSIPFAIPPGNRRIDPLRDTEEYSDPVNRDPFDGRTLDSNNKSQSNSLKSKNNSSSSNFRVVAGSPTDDSTIQQLCGIECELSYGHLQFMSDDIGFQTKGFEGSRNEEGAPLAPLHYTQTAASVRQLSKTTQNSPHALPLNKILGDDTLHPVGDAKISAGVFRGDVVTTQFPSNPSSPIPS
jgi:hypothetical protein